MILDGKKTSEKILKKLAEKVKTLDKKPKLAVILAGNDPASEIYVKNKEKAANKIGVESVVIKFLDNVDEELIVSKIQELNNDETVTGILVQLPLPAHIDKNRIIDTISPQKDIDCFTSENVGKFMQGRKPYFYPVTPQGIMMLLDEYNIDVKGKHAVVIGRSNIVGKPMAQMLLNRDATVTVCHSKTKNLDDIIKTADILISAVGKKVVRCKMVKCESVVIDVGISRDNNGNIVGDVDFDNLVNVVRYISPVPGGVGPMTIASLMVNLLN